MLTKNKVFLCKIRAENCAVQNYEGEMLERLFIYFRVECSGGMF